MRNHWILTLLCLSPFLSSPLVKATITLPSSAALKVQEPLVRQSSDLLRLLDLSGQGKNDESQAKSRILSRRFFASRNRRLRLKLSLLENPGFESLGQKFRADPKLLNLLAEVIASQVPRWQLYRTNLSDPSQVHKVLEGSKSLNNILHLWLWLRDHAKDLHEIVEQLNAIEGLQNQSFSDSLMYVPMVGASLLSGAIYAILATNPGMAVPFPEHLQPLLESLDNIAFFSGFAGVNGILLKNLFSQPMAKMAFDPKLYQAVMHSELHTQKHAKKLDEALRGAKETRKSEKLSFSKFKVDFHSLAALLYVQVFSYQSLKLFQSEMFTRASIVEFSTFLLSTLIIQDQAYSVRHVKNEKGQTVLNLNQLRDNIMGKLNQELIGYNEEAQKLKSELLAIL